MFFRPTSSAIALLALAGPALADVTPAQVWQNWIDYYKANGYAVTEGAREQAGETLSLKNVVFAYDAPQDGAKINLSAPEITLTATGDGKVRTVFADDMPVRLDFTDEDGKPVSVTGALHMADFEMISSGSAGDMTHDSRAGEAGVTLATITNDEGEKPLPVSVKLVNVTSRQHVVDGAATAIDATGSADRLELSADLGDQDGHAAVKGTLNRLAGEVSYALPQGISVGRDLSGALKAGLSMSGKLSTEGGLLDIAATEKKEEGGDRTTQVKADAKGVDLTFSLAQDGMKYQTSSDATSVEVSSPDLPFPISYAAQSATGDFQVPVSKSDQPQPFKFAYSIAGLTIGDAVWNSFDPGKKLPRDPASIDLDLTGMAKVNADLFDPALAEAAGQADAAAPAAAKDPEQAADEAEAAADGSAPDAAADGTSTPETVAATPDPFTPTEITINKLAVDAVGARLDASGSLSIPEGDTVETPVGQISARLDGANGLMDKLVDMGLVQSDQVAGLRMMLAMFAKPAPEGGDALVSEVEFKQGGEVFANGQKIK